MKYLRVKNLEKHQHYKDRRPPWIKLHAEVLDDYGFSCLQDASKAHLMLLWVLASRLDNKIPYDLAWITKQIGASSPVDMEELILHGFMETFDDGSKLLAPSKRSAMPETETETEKRTALVDQPPSTVAPRVRRAKREEPPLFGIAWAAYPRRAGSNPRNDALAQWLARVREGASEADMFAGTERYKAFCDAMGKTGTETVMQAKRFYGRNREFADLWDVPALAAPQASKEHWSDKRAREEREASEWNRIERLVSTRRARAEDGDLWWNRMQRESGLTNLRELYRYAFNHLDASAA